MSVNGASKLTPVVSVIMANYNGAAYIAESVRSVLSQTLDEIELIVCDDGSSDDSLARAEAEAAGDPRLVLLKSETNGGPGAARNRGLDAARGRWLAVVDNDDLIAPERLARLVEWAERDGADIAADDMLTFYTDKSRTPHRHLRGAYAENPHWIDAADYAASNQLLRGGGHLGYLKPLIRREALAGAGYDPALRVGEDSDLVLRLLMRGAAMRLYPEVGYHYRKHSASISHRLTDADIDAMLKAHDRLPECNDVRLAGALKLQRDAILDARAYSDLVSAMKARSFRQTLTVATRRPSAMLLLREPIAKRLGIAR
jgi:glycosyltransferase involved in cell wall biosynthesis